MKLVQIVFQAFFWSYVPDAYRDERDFVVTSVSDFSTDVSGGVGVLGEDQHHDLGGVDPPHNGGRPAFAWDDVSRRDPAADAGRLQAVANRVGG